MASEKKERVLSEKELARKNRIDKITDDLAKQGYVRKDNIVSVSTATAMSIVLGLPFIALFIVWFLVHNGSISFESLLSNFGIFVVAQLILIVVHEGIHGITWGLCAPSKFKTIEFGFVATKMVPYCTCGEPLKKTHFILGAFMPCLVLGIIPCIFAVYLNSILLLTIGVLMILGAGGDLTIILNMLRYKTSSNNVILMDHPTECGFIVFER